jgi:hypothetical protein
MQCKDIPTASILEFLAKMGPYEWANWFDGDERDVSKSMPPGIDKNLVLAKMRSLIRRELVDGCGCGCRGDFYITDKGRELLEKRKESTDGP